MLPPITSALTSTPSVPTSKKSPVSPRGTSRSCSKYENVQMVPFEIVPLLEVAMRIRLFEKVAPKFSAVTNQRPEIRS
jgi:hypothetical protein